MTEPEFSQRLAAYARHVNPQYVAFLRRHQIALDVVHAEGSLVLSRDGKQYIDCIAGYGNLNLGHNNPRVIEAVVDQLKSSLPFNWPFISDPQTRLAKKLVELTNGSLSRCAIVNSGTEAVDSALKLVRLATGKHRVICMRGGWHGFSLGALSVSEPSLCRSFTPLLGGVVQVPYGDVEAVEQAINGETGAVIVEPIQAESGAVVPPQGYLRDLASLCKRKNVVLIFDEIKTGMGKTGRLFACEHEEIWPDILLFGKALGGGVMPIGGMLARDHLWKRFGLSFPMSSSSAAGNAPACAAALSVLEIIESDDMCSRAEKQGAILIAGLRTLVHDFDSVLRGVSGRGLLLGLHIDTMKTASAVISECADSGLLLMTAFCDRNRLLIEPPLCISEEQIELVLGVLRAVFDKISRRIE